MPATNEASKLRLPTIFYSFIEYLKSMNLPNVKDYDFSVMFDEKLHKKLLKIIERLSS